MTCKERLDTPAVQALGSLPLAVHQHHALPPPWLTRPPHRGIGDLASVWPHPVVFLSKAVPSQPNF